jgi:hypothetical protein
MDDARMIRARTRALVSRRSCLADRRSGWHEMPTHNMNIRYFASSAVIEIENVRLESSIAFIFNVQFTILNLLVFSSQSPPVTLIDVE